MKTVSRVYDTYAQARDAVTAVEAAGVPTSEVSLVANKYVSWRFAPSSVTAVIDSLAPLV